MRLPLHAPDPGPPPVLPKTDPVMLHGQDFVGAAPAHLPAPPSPARRRVQIFHDRAREPEGGDGGDPVSQAGLGDAVAATRSAAAVCIAGMHRSGTSMVARLLHACGLFLGREEELTQPALDNPEGFWEDLHFVRLNDDLLARLGGKWDEPPPFPARWEFAPEVSPLLEQAGELIARFRRHHRWGWKDPRNSLTIPFWRRLIPDLKVVVCVRNPLEVAHSLYVRGDSSSASLFQLWLTYYRQLLSAVPPAQRVVTHYQTYFQDPRAEVRRVSDWLGLHASDETVGRACAHISDALRHHQVSTNELTAAGASDEVVELYLSLCAEAGPVCRRLVEREAAPGAVRAAARESTPEAYAHTLELMRLGNRLARGEEKLRSLEDEIASLKNQLRECQGAVVSLNPLARALDALRAVRTRLRSVGGGRES